MEYQPNHPHHEKHQEQECDEEQNLDNSTAHWMGRCTLVSWIDLPQYDNSYSEQIMEFPMGETNGNGIKQGVSSSRRRGAKTRRNRGSLPRPQPKPSATPSENIRVYIGRQVEEGILKASDAEKLLQVDPSEDSARTQVINILASPRSEMLVSAAKSPNDENLTKSLNTIRGIRRVQHRMTAYILNNISSDNIGPAERKTK